MGNAPLMGEAPRELVWVACNAGANIKKFFIFNHVCDRQMIVDTRSTASMRTNLCGDTKH